jgi:4-amino-4-deoxy-L-arabinose transferase-like glycosyltransferase
MAAHSKLLVKNPSEAGVRGESLKTHRFTREQIIAAIGLVLIIVLGAFLRFYQLGAYSIGNTYYAATVQSMLTSWHNFFYAAFEPGGSVSVDKPPLGFWLQAISALVYFSFTTGLWRTYYLTMLGSALAALVAASVWALWQVLKEYPAYGWILMAYLTGITLIFQIITFWQFPNYALPVTVTISVTWLVGMALLAWQQPKTWLGNVAVVLVCISLLIAPLTLSGLTTFNTHPDVGLPNAGPDASQAAGPNMHSTLPAAEKVILAYLLANTAPGSYLVATLDSHQAAPYILATKRPVLTFGGFSGSDKVISVDQLAQMVASGELRFVLAGPQLTQRKPEIGNWVTQHCSIVTLAGMTSPSTATSQIQRPGGMQPSPSTPYDCAID